MSVRTIQLFTDVHMGQGHDALSRMADEQGIDAYTLPAGQILMFLNKRKDKLKILGHKGLVVGYLKMPAGERIALDAIQFLPQTFGADGEINYPQALRRSLEQRLSGTPPRSTRTAARAATLNA